MRSLASLVLVLLALVLPGACGGGGGGSTGDDDGGVTPTLPPLYADKRVNTDPPGSELSLYPAVCCDGFKVYVVWYDRRNGDLDIYFNRSLDGGQTWLAQDTRLDSGVAGAAGSILPRICCSGSSVYVTWYDYRSGDPDIRFNRSLDSGATWLAQDIRLDTDPAGAASSREPSICCDGPRVYVAWHDDRSGSWDIRFNRSLDSGATWLASDLRIDGDTTGGDAQFVTLACAGTNVGAVWSDDRLGGTSVLFRRSLDGGLTWADTDAVLDDAAMAGVPRLARHGDNLHVAWTDVRDGTPRIRYNRSTNGGVAWLASDVRLDRGGGGASNPSICAFGQDVYVVWQDTRSGEADVYFQRSADAGATWQVADMRMDLDRAGTATSWDPLVCCTEHDVHVCWRDDRDGAFDIYHRWSGDRGLTWSSPELRLDTDPKGASHSTGQAMCCAGPFAGVAWMDERHAGGTGSDIYGNLADFAPDR